MLCYPMLWYGIESMVCYEISMLCYEISMQCYAMVYLVKDKHSATVWNTRLTTSGTLLSCILGLVDGSWMFLSCDFASLCAGYFSDGTGLAYDGTLCSWCGRFLFSWYWGLATILTLDVSRDSMRSSKVLTAAHSVAFVACWILSGSKLCASSAKHALFKFLIPPLLSDCAESNRSWCGV